MPYRFEVSPNNRAGCQTKECKDNKIKILKGELRVGTWVDTERLQYWAWRHWGCTTPRVLDNIKTSIQEGDDLSYDVLDGFEELSSEMQDKIKIALEKGHIEDEEWNGDVTHNRPGMSGMFPRKPRAKATSKTPSPTKKATASAEGDNTAANGEAEAESPKKAVKGQKKSNGKSKAKDEAEATNESSPEKKKPVAKRKKPAPAEVTPDDHNSDEPTPKRKRSTRIKKDVTESAAGDKTTPAKRARRSAKATANPKGSSAKKTTQEQDIDENEAANTEKPTSGDDAAENPQDND